MESKEHFEISTSEKNGTVEITLKGEIVASAFGKMLSRIYQVIGEMNPDRVLIDFSSVKGSAGIPQTYFHVSDYPSSFHNIKHAFVDSPNHDEMGSLIQYVATHILGISLKYFTDINDARKWLDNK